MESSLDTILQFIKKHPGCTKYDIAKAISFDTRWINKQLYAELKKEKSRIFSDDNTPPRWFYKESDKGRTQNEQASKKAKFEPDDHTLKVMKYVDEGKNVFVTGKAGTGKTRLLEEIYNTNNEKPCNQRKVIVVLAPTGVAAEHIQESAGIEAHTIHSFFKLPLAPYVAGHKNDALLELKEEQIDAIEELDMLIIDEISMVRCDVLDAVDTVLRHYRKKQTPFGGVQIVLFGDLYQLMPVAKSEEWRKIEEYYETYYFFSSHALAELEYYYCELMTPHRHKKDDIFLNVLNNVRESKMTLDDLQVINSRLILDMPQNINDNMVILMTKNRKVNNHNKEELSKISNPVVTYRAIYDENWHGKKPIEPPSLNLKIGAKVMFVKNDTLEGEYRNGTIGHIVELEEDYIQVKIDKTQKIVTVRKQTWEQYDFTIDKKERRIITTVTAQFKQFPLKLAWAVTVHKSQGLTLDNVILDVADSFTYGQIYVALSRCRTLEGIHLLKRIPSHKIMVDDKVEDFKKSVGKDGRIGKLPSYKYDGLDATSANTITLPITTRRSKVLDSLRRRATNRYDRSISCESIAREVFVFCNGKITPNRLFSHLNREWKFNDYNNGDCPFEVRKCKYAKLFLKDKSESSLFRLNDRIQIDRCENSDYWKAILILGECINDKRRKNNELRP